MATGDTKTESYLRIAAEGERDDLPTDNCCNTKTQNLILGVANRIMDVEDEVEELKNNPDVVDIVDTYADLQAYDTSTLTDKDIIRVLEDSTHNNKSTYYRWNASTSQFDYIGEAGGSGPNVVQVIGSSTTDVMSQDATSKLVFNGGSYPLAIRIGNDNDTNAMDTISIGAFNNVSGNGSISIGTNASANAGSSVAIGDHAIAYNNGGIALGSYSSTGVGNYNIAIGNGAGADSGRSGIVSFKKSSTWKYNSYNHTGYMVLAGVHDGVEANDAATVGQLDGRVKQNAGAPTTATVGTVGQLLEDTTNGKLYQCTAVDTTDPNNPSYTWAEVGGGGGVNVVQTTGSSQTDVMSQDATTKMVFQGGVHPTAIRIGNTNNSTYDDSISIGVGANSVKGVGAIAIGPAAVCNTNNCPIAIGDTANASSDNTVALGRNATASGYEGISIGRNAKVTNSSGISIGSYAKTSANYGVTIGSRTVNAAGGIAIGGANNSDYGVASTAPGGVAIGFNSHATRAGEVNIGDYVSAYGFNNSAYRVLGGVYDGQELHDAATVAQGNTLATSAPTTSTVGVLGQLYTDTTGMHTYQCTAISGSTYTWTQRW